MSDILKSLFYFIPGIIILALVAKYLWRPFVSSTSNKVKKVTKRAGIYKSLIGLFALGYILYCALFYFQISMDDGPFRGMERTECANLKPDQVFPLNSEYSLYVYDRTHEEIAPTVALKSGDGRILWCIFATGWEKSNVDKLRFGSVVTPIPLMSPYIRGEVFWTYGHERMTWSIANDGTLNWYKYSW
jgi:hypothetical protein